MKHVLLGIERRSPTHDGSPRILELCTARVHRRRLHGDLPNHDQVQPALAAASGWVSGKPDAMGPA